MCCILVCKCGVRLNLVTWLGVGSRPFAEPLWGQIHVRSLPCLFYIIMIIIIFGFFVQRSYSIRLHLLFQVRVMTSYRLRPRASVRPSGPLSASISFLADAHFHPPHAHHLSPRWPSPRTPSPDTHPPTLEHIRHCRRVHVLALTSAHTTSARLIVAKTASR